MRSKAWLAQISEKQKDGEAAMLTIWSPVYCGRLRQDTNLLANSRLLGMAKKVPVFPKTSLWESEAQVPVLEVIKGRVREFAPKGLST